MFVNLRRDLQRYCEWWGYGDDPGLLYKVLVLCRSPGYWAIIHHRFGFWVNTVLPYGYKNPVKLFLKLIYFLTRPFIVWFAKIELLVTTDIGPGLFLSNKGNIIAGLRRVGKNCTIHHNVTIGQDVTGEVPEFGNNICVGHDSIVYGGLSVGDNTIIKSGTVLAKSLPGNMLVGGNPCRILNRKIGEGPYPIKEQEC